MKNMEINQRNFRKEHLAIRNAMLPGEVAEKSSAIVKRLLQSEWYKDTERNFCLLSVRERSGLPCIVFTGMGRWKTDRPSKDERGKSDGFFLY